MHNEENLKRKEWCESDYDLLRKPLPVYPCGMCPERFSSLECSKCPKSDVYNQQVQPYKDAGIMDAVEIIQEIYNLDKQIESLDKEKRALVQELTGTGCNVNKLFKVQILTEAVPEDNKSAVMSIF